MQTYLLYTNMDTTTTRQDRIVEKDINDDLEYVSIALPS